MSDFMKREKEIEERGGTPPDTSGGPASLARIIEVANDVLYKTHPLDIKRIINIVMCHRVALKQWLIALDKDLNGDDPPEWLTEIVDEATKLRDQSLDN